MSQENNHDNHEKVLQDLKSFTNSTKELLEKVKKMRLECKDTQMQMLRLFNPKCIKILQMSQELVPKEVGKVNKDTKIRIKHSGLKKKKQTVHFEDMDFEVSTK